MGVRLPREGNVHGLFVGVDRYDAMRPTGASRGRRDLAGCTNDATHLSRAAEPFLSTNVVLTDQAAHRKSILDHVEQVVKRAASGDLFILFCACHGSVNYGEFFLWPSDFDEREFLGTSLLFQDIANAVGSRPDVSSLIIIDACQSGAIGFDPARHNRGLSSSIMVAAAPLQESKERKFDSEGHAHMPGDPVEGRVHGVFGYSLIRQLHKFFDGDGPGEATVAEIFRGAYEDTTRILNHAHHPVLVGTLPAHQKLRRRDRKAPGGPPTDGERNAGPSAP